MGARAAVLLMFVLFLLADLAAGWLSVPGLTGFGFAAASAIAAGRARREDLLIVVVTPPLTYLVAVTCAELINAHADHAAISVSSIGAGVFLTLSAAAPWMFAGLAGAVAIAAVRGLRQCVRDLRAGPSGRAER
ncbi:MAG TPA: DUF6542 domain-containing protein [Streptosporangiaceae bacterium]|nr:DUF6542 domain-containing protein [Streptosporangiaceae bacterium]